MAGEHYCAVEGCNVKVAADRLMCRPHWLGLPMKLQRDVNGAWSRVRREPEAYREAREAAVEWWRGRQPGGYGKQGTLL